MLVGRDPRCGRRREVIWWLIPLCATLAAWLYTRGSTRVGGRVRTRPEPGSQADRADLARFAQALACPLPGARNE